MMKRSDRVERRVPMKDRVRVERYFLKKGCVLMEGCVGMKRSDRVERRVLMKDRVRVERYFLKKGCVLMKERVRGERRWAVVRL